VLWGLFAIYVVLVVLVIIDVLRQPASALSGLGKALWVAAFLLVPILPCAILWGGANGVAWAFTAALGAGTGLTFLRIKRILLT